MHIPTLVSALAPCLCAALASAQSYSGTVDSSASSGTLSTVAELTSSGSLIGDFDAANNPGGTLTRPGLFGGSGNNPIPTSADFTATADLQSQPSGTIQIEADFGGLTIRLGGLSLDLLNGAVGGTDLSITLLFSTFNTVSPSFIYPGGVPITVPLGEAATITRAELVQSAPADGLLIPTADPDVFDFSALVQAEANLTLSVGLPGSAPVPNDVDALPLAVPVSGQVTRLPDGSLSVTVGGDATSAAVDTPIDTGPLPTVPFELPTLGTATAGVLITLTPEALTFEAVLGLNLTFNAELAACDADWNLDGDLNFFDIVGYINSYNSQDPRADLAAPFGSWNFFDVSAYLSSFNAGCP